MNNELTQFSIFDSKAQAYLQPFFSLNRETATREFTTAILKDGNFGNFAEDYAMFELGTFDQQTGKSELHVSPIHIVNAVTLQGRPSAHVERLPNGEIVPWDPNLKIEDPSPFVQTLNRKESS